MNRRLVAVGVVSVLAIAGVSVVLVLNPYGTNFHLEEHFPEPGTDASYVQLGLHNLRDCCLNISFVNDTSLIYRMDIELYSAAFENSAFGFRSQLAGTPTGWFVKLDASVIIRSLTLVLGTGLPYMLGVFGTNLTSAVTYGNGSLLTVAYHGSSEVDHTEFFYSATGSLQFAFLDNVNFTQRALRVDIGSPSPWPESVTIHVEIPSALHGVFYYGQDASPQISLGARWSWRGTGNYGTDEGEPDPCLSMFVHSPSIVAYLG